MMTEKEVKVPARKASVTKKTVYVCDICSKEEKNIRECCMCGRDVCDQYYTMRSCCYDDPHCYGDYPGKYCRICYDLRFKKYDDIYNQISNDYDNAINLMDEKIKKESLLTSVNT